jgi:hypothetical protein
MTMTNLSYIPRFSVFLSADLYRGIFFKILARIVLILFGGFRGEDLNVKVYDVRPTPIDG